MRYVLSILGAFLSFTWTIYLNRTGYMVPSLSCFLVTILATVGGATTGYWVGMICTRIDMALLKD